MIPDKIYIRHYLMPGALDDEWRLKPIEDEQCEEYINKGKMLEWLRNNGVEGGVGDDYHNGFNDGLYAVMQMLKQI